jgi:hypothetical protein
VPPVSLVGVPVPYVAVPRSPEPRRRRCSPWVAARRRRHFGEPLLSSRARARRSSANRGPNRAPWREIDLRRRAHRPAPPRAAAVRLRRRPVRLCKIWATGFPIYGPEHVNSPVKAAYRSTRAASDLGRRIPIRWIRSILLTLAARFCK